MNLPPFKNEPFTDFSTPDNKRGMQEALARVRAELGRTYDMRIGGKAVQTGESSISSTTPVQTLCSAAALRIRTTHSAAAAAASSPSSPLNTPVVVARSSERVGDGVLKTASGCRRCVAAAVKCEQVLFMLMLAGRCEGGHVDQPVPLTILGDHIIGKAEGLPEPSRLRALRDFPRMCFGLGIGDVPHAFARDRRQLRACLEHQNSRARRRLQKSSCVGGADGATADDDDGRRIG